MNETEPFIDGVFSKKILCNNMYLMRTNCRADKILCRKSRLFVRATFKCLGLARLLIHATFFYCISARLLLNSIFCFVFIYINFTTSRWFSPKFWTKMENIAYHDCSSLSCLTFHQNLSLVANKTVGYKKIVLQVKKLFLT